MFDPSGLPGVGNSVFASPRNIFYSDPPSGAFLPVPIIFDGTLAYNAANAPYTFLAFAGTFIGRVSATGKFAGSILGLSAAAYASGSTSLVTDPDTAAAIVSRIGNSGTLQIAGPATAGGSMQTATLTFSAVNAATGVITVTAGTSSFIAGSLIQPTDGSQSIVTLLAELFGTKTTDWTNVNKVDAMVAKAYAGGILNSSMLVNYPTDPSLRAYIKSQIRGNGVPVAMFSDDFGA